MRIGELGKAVGVDIETIRYYEKVGLLPTPARQEGHSSADSRTRHTEP